MLLLAAAIVGLLGLGGGFGEAEPLGLQRLSAANTGATLVETKPYTVEVGQGRSVNGKFEVPLTITVTGDHPMAAGWDLNRAIKLKDTKTAPRFVRAGEGGQQAVQTLSPGVSTKITAQWPDSPGAKTLELYSLTWRKSSLDGSMQWLSPELIAKVELR